MQALADARQELVRRAPLVKPPRVVFVSVDPQRDTAASDRGLSEPASIRHFVGATATNKVLEPLLATFGVTVEKQRQGATPYTLVA